MAKPLNPALLGRPIQTLDALAKTLSLRIGQHLQETGHRSVALELREASWQPVRPGNCNGAEAPLLIELSRSTVHALMDARYGFHAEEEIASASDLPVSATEKRITEQLHQAITDAVQALIRPANKPPAACTQPYAWQWSAQIQVANAAPQDLRITLCAALSAQLELLLQRPRSTKPATTTDTALLAIELQALLLEKTVSAADIQQLQVGSVLPITLNRTLVHLNGQAMLAASVAENHGKLHLTAFENLE